jgi:hypothetical protein
MVQKLESQSQVLSLNGFAVVDKTRMLSRPAVQAPASVLSVRLSATDTDRANPYGVNPCGLGAGRSLGLGGSRLSRRLSGHAGATCRTRGAKPKADKHPRALAQRGGRVIPIRWCLGRMCETSRSGRQRSRTRPVV